MTEPSPILYDEIVFSMLAAAAFENALDRLLGSPVSEIEVQNPQEKRRPVCECRRLWL